MLPSGEVVDLQPMPARSAGNKRELDTSAILDFLKAVRIDFCALERSQSMPGQGVVSVFNYGVGFGLLQGLLSALKIPYELIPPTSWTKDLHAGLPQSAKPKEKSRTAAERLFPGLDLRAPGGRVPHEGLIDALLIAEWARRRRVWLDSGRSAR